jgi:membrane fusion protein, heavy metal efflux system
LGDFAVTSFRSLLAAIAASALLMAAPAALAGPGHDHGDEAPAAVGEVAPRLSAMTERHEMVAVVRGADLLIWINRFADSAPVTDAQVDVTIDSTTARAQAQPDGTYTVAAGPLAAHEEAPNGQDADTHAEHSVLVSVTTPEGTDLLTGALSHDHEAHDHAEGSLPWLWIGLGAVAVAGLGAAVAWRHRRRAATAVALTAATLFAVQPAPAIAGPGHDHGEEAAAPVGGEVAQRLPDGALFVPMAVQRTLGVRTAVSVAEAAAVTVSLNGHVIVDPNAGGVVQPTTAGRLMPPPGGFPALGSRVSAGQVLAYVEPAIEGADRAALAQEAAAIETELATAQARLARLERLEGVVPQREIDDARLSVDGLQRRRAATAGGRAPREALRAPVAGVIASATAQAGAVVEGRTIVFEIIDPNRLQVEATITDARELGQNASADAGGSALRLERAGAGRADAAGASIIRYRIVEGADAVRLNQPVTVFAATIASVSGVAVPRAAVVRGQNGQSIVFVKTSPERIEPRVVTFEIVSADRVVITNGVAAGERVIVAGAQLIAQIR